MPSAMHNLERESILLLYQAGELSAEDQREVEAMLSADGALRAEFEQLTVAQQTLDASLTAADAHQPLPAPATSSARQVARAIAQWKVDRLAAKPAPQRGNGRRFGWMYSAGAVAAAIVVTVFILWSRVDDGKSNIAKDFPDIIDNIDKETENPSPASTDAAASNETEESDAYTPIARGIETQLSRAEIDLIALSTLTDSLRTEEAVTP